MPPPRCRALLPILMAAYVEWNWFQAGVQAQQAVGDEDNPCYLDAELGCAAEGKSCGRISDLCGGTIDCGVCGDPCDESDPTRACQTCEDNVCTCLPATCEVLDAQCGVAFDFCGDTLPCAAPCFDDPWWATAGGASCAVFALNPDWDCGADYAVSSGGVYASEACPVTCRTGCYDYMIDYANVQPDDGRCGAGQYCEGPRAEQYVGNTTHGSLQTHLVGSSRCVVCDDGFMPFSDQLSCVQCPSGSAGVGGICVPCVAYRSKWMETLTPNAARTGCECTGNPGFCAATWCGTTPDGCGGTIECGGCENLVGGVFGYACNHTASECECVPDTCEILNATCGDAVPDGCGGFIECGACEDKNGWGSNYSCSDATGASVPHLQQPNLTAASHQCACVPERAEDLCPRVNTTCGTLPDGCGGLVECLGCGGLGEIPCEVSAALRSSGRGVGGGSWGEATPVTWDLNVSMESGDRETWTYGCDPHQNCSLVGMVLCGGDCVPAMATASWNSCDDEQDCAALGMVLCDGSCVPALALPGRDLWSDCENNAFSIVTRDSSLNCSGLGMVLKDNTCVPAHRWPGFADRCEIGTQCLGTADFKFETAEDDYSQGCRCVDSHICECEPRNCSNADPTWKTSCGIVSDGCGGLLDCGECSIDHVCVPFDVKYAINNVCECVPRTCEPGQCGVVSDGCGGEINCAGATVVGPPGVSFEGCEPLSCPFTTFTVEETRAWEYFTENPRGVCYHWLDDNQDVQETCTNLLPDIRSSPNSILPREGTGHLVRENHPGPGYPPYPNTGSYKGYGHTRNVSKLHRSDGASEYWSPGSTTANQPKLQRMPECYDIDEAAKMAYANSTLNVTTCAQAVALISEFAFSWDPCNTDMREPCDSLEDFLPNCGIVGFLGCDYELAGATLRDKWCPKTCCDIYGPPEWFARVGVPMCIDRNGYHVTTVMDKEGELHDIVNETSCEIIWRNNTWQDSVPAMCTMENGTWPFVGTWVQPSETVCELMGTGHTYTGDPDRVSGPPQDLEMYGDGGVCAWLPGDHDTTRRRTETQRALGPVDIELGPRLPTAIPIVSAETAPSGVEWRQLSSASGQSCRYTHPLDNSEDYYELHELGSRSNRPDHYACQELCEINRHFCRGYEYAVVTGKCELWKVKPQSSVPASGMYCFSREAPNSLGFSVPVYYKVNEPSFIQVSVMDLTWSSWCGGNSDTVIMPGEGNVDVIMTNFAEGVMPKRTTSVENHTLYGDHMDPYTIGEGCGNPGQRYYYAVAIIPLEHQHNYSTMWGAVFPGARDFIGVTAGDTYEEVCPERSDGKCDPLSMGATDREYCEDNGGVWYNNPKEVNCTDNDWNWITWNCSDPDGGPWNCSDLDQTHCEVKLTGNTWHEPEDYLCTQNDTMIEDSWDYPPDWRMPQPPPGKPRTQIECEVFFTGHTWYEYPHNISAPSNVDIAPEGWDAPRPPEHLVPQEINFGLGGGPSVWSKTPDEIRIGTYNFTMGAVCPLSCNLCPITNRVDTTKAVMNVTHITGRVPVCDTYSQRRCLEQCGATNVNPDPNSTDFVAPAGCLNVALELVDNFEPMDLEVAGYNMTQCEIFDATCEDRWTYPLTGEELCTKGRLTTWSPGGNTCHPSEEPRFGYGEDRMCTCQQTTCDLELRNCGLVDDDCGGHIYCGDCPDKTYGEVTWSGACVNNICEWTGMLGYTSFEEPYVNTSLDIDVLRYQDEEPPAQFGLTSGFQMTSHFLKVMDGAAVCTNKINLGGGLFAHQVADEVPETCRGIADEIPQVNETCTLNTSFAASDDFDCRWGGNMCCEDITQCCVMHCTSPFRQRLDCTPYVQGSPEEPSDTCPPQCVLVNATAAYTDVCNITGDCRFTPDEPDSCGEGCIYHEYKPEVVEVLAEPPRCNGTATEVPSNCTGTASVVPPKCWGNASVAPFEPEICENFNYGPGTDGGMCQDVCVSQCDVTCREDGTINCDKTYDQYGFSIPYVQGNSTHPSTTCPIAGSGYSHPGCTLIRAREPYVPNCTVPETGNDPFGLPTRDDCPAGCNFTAAHVPECDGGDGSRENCTAGCDYAPPFRDTCEFKRSYAGLEYLGRPEEPWNCPHGCNFYNAVLPILPEHEVIESCTREPTNCPKGCDYTPFFTPKCDETFALGMGGAWAIPEVIQHDQLGTVLPGHVAPTPILTPTEGPALYDSSGALVSRTPTIGPFWDPHGPPQCLIWDRRIPDLCLHWVPSDQTAVQTDVMAMIGDDPNEINCPRGCSYTPPYDALLPVGYEACGIKCTIEDVKRGVCLSTYREIGFTTYWLSTGNRDGLGLTDDGAVLGVVGDASTTHDGNGGGIAPHGHKYFTMANTDGFVYVTLDPLNATGMAFVYVSGWVQLGFAAWEENDFTKVWVEGGNGDEYNMFHLDDETDLDLIQHGPDAIPEGQWMQLNTTLTGQGWVTVKFGHYAENDYETAFFDHFRVTARTFDGPPISQHPTCPMPVVPSEPEPEPYPEPEPEPYPEPEPSPEPYPEPEPEPEPQVCTRGYEPNEDRSACIPCAEIGDGYYFSSDGARCRRCEVGKEPSLTRTQCTLCIQTVSEDGRVCVGCEPGKAPRYAAGAKTCEWCGDMRIKTHSPNGTVCELCPPGMVADQNFTTCKQCPPDKYDNGTHCDSCVNPPGWNYGPELAFEPDENQTGCKQSCPMGFGPRANECHIDINECASNPCFNGATCNDLIARYTCTCVAGWIGEHCEIERDECESHPCANDPVLCTDLFNAYRCTCSDGWDGNNCEHDIDECLSSPCWQQHGRNLFVHGSTLPEAAWPNGTNGTNTTLDQWDRLICESVDVSGDDIDDAREACESAGKSDGFPSPCTFVAFGWASAEREEFPLYGDPVGGSCLNEERLYPETRVLESNQNVSGADDCAQVCSSDEQCTGFTIVVADDVCQLHTTTTYADNTVTNLGSSVVLDGSDDGSPDFTLCYQRLTVPTSCKVTTQYKNGTVMRNVAAWFFDPALDTIDVQDSCSSTLVPSITTSDTTLCTLTASNDYGITAGACEATGNTATCVYVGGTYSASTLDTVDRADTCTSTNLTGHDIPSDTVACTLTPSADFGVTDGSCEAVDDDVATCTYVNGSYSAQTLDTVDAPDSCTSSVLPLVTTSDTALCTLTSSTSFGITPGACEPTSNIATCEYVPGIYSASGKGTLVQDGIAVHANGIAIGQDASPCIDSRIDATLPVNSYQCECVTGYQGFNCAVDVDECDGIGAGKCKHAHTSTRTIISFGLGVAWEDTAGAYEWIDDSQKEVENAEYNVASAFESGDLEGQVITAQLLVQAQTAAARAEIDAVASAEMWNQTFMLVNSALQVIAGIDVVGNVRTLSDVRDIRPNDVNGHYYMSELVNGKVGYKCVETSGQLYWRPDNGGEWVMSDQPGLYIFARVFGNDSPPPFYGWSVWTGDWVQEEHGRVTTGPGYIVEGSIYQHSINGAYRELGTANGYPAYTSTNMKILYWRPDQGGQWCIADAPLQSRSYVRACTVGPAPLGGRLWDPGPPSGTDVMSTGNIDLWYGWMNEWGEEYTMTVTPTVIYDIRSYEQRSITGRYMLVDEPLSNYSVYKTVAGQVLYWRDRGPIPDGEADPCLDTFALNDARATCNLGIGCLFTPAGEDGTPPSCMTTTRGQWVIADRIGGNLRAVTNPAAHASYEAGPPIVSRSGTDTTWYLWSDGWVLEPETHITVLLGVDYPEDRPYVNAWPVPDPPCGYPVTEHVGVCLEAVEFGADSVTFTLLEGNRTDAETYLPSAAKLDIPYLAEMAERLFPWRYREPYLMLRAVPEAEEIGTDESIYQEVLDDGSKCLNVVGDYFCDCSVGWEGKDCTQDIDECASNPCQNRAPCTDTIGNYTCDCVHGWRGDNCAIIIDPCEEPREILRFGLPFDNRGPNEDWSTSADNCDPDHAFCIHTGPALFECQCDPGYESDNGGVLCTDIDECLSHPCQHNSTCTDLIDIDGDCPTCFEGYNCTCDVGVGGVYQQGVYSGFEGFNCEINIDECLSNPCVRGNCTDRIATYLCVCPGGWEGYECELDIDECRSSPCHPVSSTACDDTTSLGIRNHPIDAYTCTCVPGWEGHECQLATPPPPMPAAQKAHFFELLLGMSIHDVPRRSFYHEKDDWVEFRDELEEDVANLLEVEPRRVELWEVLAGSVLAIFKVEMTDLAFEEPRCAAEGPHCQPPWEWFEALAPGSPPIVHPSYVAPDGRVARYLAASVRDVDSPSRAAARLESAVAAGLAENHRCVSRDPELDGKWLCADPVVIGFERDVEGNILTNRGGVEILGFNQLYNITAPEPEPEPEPQPEPEPEPEPPEPTWLEAFYCDEPYTMGYPDVPARRVCNAGAIVVTIGLFFLLVAFVLSIILGLRRRAARLMEKVHPMTDMAQIEDRPSSAPDDQPGPPSTPALQNGRKAKVYLEDAPSVPEGYRRDRFGNLHPITGEEISSQFRERIGKRSP
jgi:hypothetical protein